MCRLIARQENEYYYHGPELQDEKTLEFCGICEGTILFLSQATVTIFVKTLFGKVVTCEVSPNWDVLRLKRLIEEKEGIPLSTPPILSANVIPPSDCHTRRLSTMLFFGKRS